MNRINRHWSMTFACLLGVGYLLTPTPTLAIDPFTLTAGASNQMGVGEPQIILMLKRDVGLSKARPIDAGWLERLALKAGIQLTWEGNTRTQGQIIGLPIGTSLSRAREAARAIRLETGVLWAEAEEARATPAVQAIANQAAQDQGEEISRFIVRLRGDRLSEELDTALLQKLVAAAGVELKVAGQTKLARILTLKPPLTLNRAKTLESALESLPEVIYADPDRRGDALQTGDITPNDPLFWRGWHLQGPYPLPDEYQGFPNGYAGAANVQSAWALTRGRNSVGVAVLDTGVLFDHPDLKRSLGRQKTRRGWDMITYMSAARDGNARDSNAQDEGTWVDAETGCPRPMAMTTSTWHGSHVAGLIAATTNNRKGVSGVNWKSKIVPVRVIGACGYVDSDLIDGILWAGGYRDIPGTRPNRIPVRIINMSLGGSGPCPDSLQESIDHVLSRGISITVAAGNDGRDVADAPPANCRGVISVAAVNHLGDRAYYSNFGTGITVAAPGGQQLWPIYDSEGKLVTQTELKAWGLWSSVNGSPGLPQTGQMSYAPLQGTSQATPVVSGVISLMLAADSKHRLTPALITEILQSSARPFPVRVPYLTQVGAGSFSWENTTLSECTTTLAGQCGAGIVDARAAVEAVLALP